MYILAEVELQTMVKQTSFKRIYCSNACYQYYCFANGKWLWGVGCEHDLKNACPDVDMASISKKHHLTVSYDDNTYSILRCTLDVCFDEMSNSENTSVSDFLIVHFNIISCFRILGIKLLKVEMKKV